MLAAFPLTTAKDRPWWSHWRSLGSPDISTSFCEATQKRSDGLAIHTIGFSCICLKVVIGLEVMVFLAFCNLCLLLLQSLPVCHCFCSGPKQKCPQLLHLIPGLGLCTRGSKSIHQASFCPLSSRQPPR